MCVHIIDGLILNGVDVRGLHFIPRLEKVKKFVKAITRPTRTDLAPIRVKDIFKTELIDEVFIMLVTLLCSFMNTVALSHTR